MSRSNEWDLLTLGGLTNNCGAKLQFQHASLQEGGRVRQETLYAEGSFLTNAQEKLARITCLFENGGGPFQK